jgi:hypothetical protein
VSRLKVFGVLPVRGGDPALEQSELSQHVGTHTDRRDATTRTKVSSGGRDSLDRRH